MRRFVILSVALLAASFFVTSCDTAPETLMSPDSESAAKGGIPGAPDKPDDGDDGGDDKSAPASNLVEYYVIPSPDGVEPNVVHVVVDGSAEFLGAGVVHDYFFDGMQTDNDSPHYEWFDPAAFNPETKFIETLSNGYTHFDVEWSGEWAASEYDCTVDPCEYVGRASVAYPDFLTTAVQTSTGSLADPFTFTPAAYTSDTTQLGWWYPDGVILDGATEGPTATIPAGYLHEGTSVQSYALFSGDDADVQVSLAHMDATDLQCTTETVREGKGRNKVWKTYTTLTATATAQFAMSDDSRHGYWAEFHLRPVGAEVSVPGPGSSINGGSSDDIGLESPREFTVSTRFEGEYGSVAVELVMDYLRYTGDSDIGLTGTYDPAANSTDGFTTVGGPSQTLGDGNWPEAVRHLGTVTCK